MATAATVSLEWFMNVSASPPRDHILLTGATGLLGSYLVRDLLLDGQPLAVIVRRSRKQDPVARVEGVLRHWESTTGQILPRPVVLEGDLTLPKCGLNSDACQWVERHCGSLLNNAASLSFRGTDRTAEPWLTNVGGTEHVLELARATGLRHLHHVSTAYVSGLRTGTGLETDLDVGQTFGNDYERSKVEAEQMVRSASHLETATVYRPSIIVGDSTTGYTSTYHGLYAGLRLGHTLLTRVRIGSTSGPALLHLLGVDPTDHKNFVPVDWVSRVISATVRNSAARGHTLHLSHPQPLSMLTVGTLIQEAVERYSQAAAADDPDLCDENWFADNLRTQLDVYQSYFRNDPTFDTTNTQTFAGHLPCPTLDMPSLLRMAKVAIETDFGRLPTPRQAPAAVPSRSVETNQTLRAAAPTA